jgi:hypothetical protein
LFGLEAAKRIIKIQNGKMDTGLLGLPEIVGGVDSDYMSEALARARRPSEVSEMTITPISGGLSQARILRITISGSQSFILKKIGNDSEGWWPKLIGGSIFEVQLWKQGITRNLPAPLFAPTLDVCFNSSSNEWWILMDDVSKFIIRADRLEVPKISWMFEGLARFHAKYMNTSELVTIPACSLDTHVRIFTEPILYLAGTSGTAPWARRIAERPQYSEVFPLLQEFFRPSDLDFYLSICKQRESWLPLLKALPQTLLHGDLHRKHIAPVTPSQVYSFDWNLPVCGPATADLTWCWFLNFWCFPPYNSKPIEHEPLRKIYIKRLGELMTSCGSAHDLERSWQLSWLKTFAQLGWCLVLPARGTNDQTQKDKVKALVEQAVIEARHIADKHL